MFMSNKCEVAFEVYSFPPLQFLSAVQCGGGGAGEHSERTHWADMEVEMSNVKYLSMPVVI